MEHYLLILLPPTFVAVLSYGSLGWFNVQPVDATHSIIRSGAVAHADMPKGDKASEDFTAAFFAEDKFICERVQRGMTSNASRGGQLVDMERIVVDFHRFWANRLGAGQPTEVFADPEQSPRWLT